MSATLPAHATVCTDAATLQVVARYIAVHDDPTAEAFGMLFTSDLTVCSPGAPPEGRNAAEYLVFLQSLKGTSFRQRHGTEPRLDGEGRVVLEWTVADRAGQQLAAGVDYLRLERGRIRHIVGVY